MESAIGGRDGDVLGFWAAFEMFQHIVGLVGSASFNFNK